MKEQLSRIEDKLDKLDEKLDLHTVKVAKVETVQRGFIAIFMTFVTAVVTFITKKFFI